VFNHIGTSHLLSPEKKDKDNLFNVKNTGSGFLVSRARDSCYIVCNITSIVIYKTIL